MEWTCTTSGRPWVKWQKPARNRVHFPCPLNHDRLVTYSWNDFPLTKTTKRHGWIVGLSMCRTVHCMHCIACTVKVCGGTKAQRRSIGLSTITLRMIIIISSQPCSVCIVISIPELPMQPAMLGLYTCLDFTLIKDRSYPGWHESLSYEHS